MLGAIATLTGTPTPRFLELQTVPKHDDVIAGKDRRRLPDITRARTLLGWEPRVSLEEGLRPTIDYLKRTLR